ncbi:MAG: tail fiber domain-containing protein [Candidatus Omnitrophica bacterium]|nr:tail fiber domain-containing protein [Candidatus Omnitrophota bacterium]
MKKIYGILLSMAVVLGFSSLVHAGTTTTKLLTSVPAPNAVYDTVQLKSAKNDGDDCSSGDQAGKLATDSNSKVLVCDKTTKKFKKVEGIWLYDSTDPAKKRIWASDTTYNVGVGTSVPKVKLEVVGNGIFGSNLTLSAANALAVGYYNANNASSLFEVGNGTNVTPASAFTVLNNGNVGVGISVPSRKLTISTATLLDGILLKDGTRWMQFMSGTVGGGSYNGITQANDNVIIYSNGTAGQGAFVIAPWSAGTTGIRMDGAGNVGMGAVTPQSTLHVNTATNDAGIEISGATNGVSPVLKFGNNAATPLIYGRMGIAGHDGALSMDAKQYDLVIRSDDPTNTNSFHNIVFNIKNGLDSNMIITKDGFVGVNTSAPSTVMQIKPPTAGNGFASLNLSGSGTGNDYVYSGIGFTDESVPNGNGYYAKDWNLSLVKCSEKPGICQSGQFPLIEGALVLQQRSTSQVGVAQNRLFIGNNGNIGLGTLKPESGLHVAKVAQYSGINITTGSVNLDGTGQNYPAGIRFNIEEPGHALGYWTGRVVDDFQFIFESPFQIGSPSANPAISSSILSFKHWAGASRPADAVGIGVAPGNMPDVNYKLYVQGNIYATGSVTQWSDVTLKKDVHTIPDALAKINQIRGVNFKWIDETRGKENQMGVIAQEVEKVFPEVVKTDDKGIKAVEYANMVGALIEAVKELNQKVDKLSAENEMLKKQMNVK